jgi:hypothetical protein
VGGTRVSESGCVEDDGWRKMCDELIKVGVNEYIAIFQDCEVLSSKTIATNELTNLASSHHHTTAHLENAENPTDVPKSPSSTNVLFPSGTPAPRRHSPQHPPPYTHVLNPLLTPGIMILTLTNLLVCIAIIVTLRSTSLSSITVSTAVTVPPLITVTPQAPQFRCTMIAVSNSFMSIGIGGGEWSWVSALGHASIQPDADCSEPKTKYYAGRDHGEGDEAYLENVDDCGGSDHCAL